MFAANRTGQRRRVFVSVMLLIAGLAVSGWLAVPRVFALPHGLIALADWALGRGVVVEMRELTVGGVTRRYRLATPRGVAAADRLPLVVALHGALDTPDEMAVYTGLDATAAAHGFAVAYLEGRLLNWPPLIPPENPDIMRPDVELFEAVCDSLVQTDRMDPARIYVVGVSQGGAMANVLTAMSSRRIAATVCNCGWLPAPLGDSPLKTERQVPMLFIVGSNDRQVSPATVRAAYDAFQQAGHPVTWHLIDGFGHGWANVDQLNELIWAFCAEHVNPAPGIPGDAR